MTPLVGFVNFASDTNTSSKEVLIPLMPYPLRSSKSKPLGMGYGFFDTLDDARGAVEALNGSEFKLRKLHVRHHVPHTPASRNRAFKGFGRFKENAFGKENEEQPVSQNKEVSADAGANGVSPPLKDVPKMKKPQNPGLSSSLRIFNGLKAKAEAAKAITSTVDDVGGDGCDGGDGGDGAEVEKTAHPQLSPTSKEASDKPPVPPRHKKGKLSARDGAAVSDDPPHKEKKRIVDAERKPILSTDTIFVRDLRGYVKRNVLQAFFQKFNPVKIKVYNRKRFGWSKSNNAFVTFDFQEGATLEQAVKEYHGKVFNGCPIRVEAAFANKVGAGSPILSVESDDGDAAQTNATTEQATNAVQPTVVDNEPEATYSPANQADGATVARDAEDVVPATLTETPTETACAGAA